MKAGDSLSIVPSVAGGAPARRRRGWKPSCQDDLRLSAGRDQALQPPPDHAGGRHGRAAQAQGGERAAASAPAASARPRRCTWPPPASAASASSTSTSSTSATCSGRCCTARRMSAARSWTSAKDRLNELNPHVQVDTYETALSSENALRAVRATTTSSSTAPTTSRRATSSTTPACCRQAERLRQHLPLRGAGVGLRAPRAARATAASIPSRRRPDWSRAAPRAACSACCRASSASSRRPRRSS